MLRLESPQDRLDECRSYGFMILRSDIHDYTKSYSYDFTTQHNSDYHVSTDSLTPNLKRSFL